MIPACGDRTPPEGEHGAYQEREGAAVKIQVRVGLSRIAGQDSSQPRTFKRALGSFSILAPGFPKKKVSSDSPRVTPTSLPLMSAMTSMARR